MRPRAVITGIGVVSPTGNGIRAYWRALVAGRSGIGLITRFDCSSSPVRIGGEVRNLDLGRYIPPERSRKMPRAAKLAVVAAKMALEDSGFKITEENRSEVDVFIGVACPDLFALSRTISRRLRHGPGFVDAMLVPNGVPAAPAGHISIELGISGESPTFSSGCSSATNAIGHALRKIRGGGGKIIFTGGADAGIQPDLIAAFAKMNSLSTKNNDPQGASRPFEAHRDGHVLSEAAGIIVLEEYEHARERGASIYAEVAGYGSSSDCHSMYEVCLDERPPALSIRRALEDARRGPEEVDYYCAHGTSAVVTDERETRVLKRALGERAYKIPVSSVKSMIGHPLGASGALQAVTCALAAREGAIPPTINYEEPDPKCDLDYVPNEAREHRVNLALTYSLGTGGNNAALATGAC